MITATFADITDIVNALPDAELAYKRSINQHNADRYINIIYRPRMKLSASPTTEIGTAHQLSFEAYPISYKKFGWKLLTPVNVKG